jgi:hypothetical protein
MTLTLVPKPSGRNAIADPFDAIENDPAFIEWLAEEAVRDLVQLHGKTKAALLLSQYLEHTT